MTNEIKEAGIDFLLEEANRLKAGLTEVSAEQYRLFLPELGKFKSEKCTIFLLEEAKRLKGSITNSSKKTYFVVLASLASSLSRF